MNEWLDVRRKEFESCCMQVYKAYGLPQGYRLIGRKYMDMYNP